MPTNDTPTAEGATNVLLNQRSLDPPYLRQSVGIQGDENVGKAIGFDANGTLTAIDVGSAGAITSVAAIAALKARSVAALTTGTAVDVLGYYATGDGGGGGFCYDSASVLADNGGTVIQPTTGSGRWLRIVEGSINVKTFGAKGDNAANDTAAIQAAIDAAPYATVFVPRGRYRIYSTITVSTSTSLIGDGIRNSSFEWYGPAGANMFEFTNQHSGGIVQGLGFLGRNISGSILDVSNRGSMTVRNCSFEQANDNFIEQHSTVAFTIVDCVFVDVPASASAKACILIDTGSGHNINRNRFNLSFDGSTKTGTAVEYLHDSNADVISQNIFEWCSVGILIPRGTSQLSLNIVGNYFEANTADYSIGSAGTGTVPAGPINFFGNIHGALASGPVTVAGATTVTMTGENVAYPITFGAAIACLTLIDNIFTGGVTNNAASCVLLQAGAIQATGPLQSGAIKATSTAGPQLSLADSATGSPQIQFLQSAVLRAFLKYDNADTMLKIDCDGRIQFSTVNTAAVTIANDGSTGIGTDTPHWSAKLDVDATTKGFLPPRMTKAQRGAIISPSDGLVIYQTDNTPGLRVKENGAWVKFTATADP